MLVLTRRMGEEIVVGENIRLTVVRVKGTKVRLGVVAPASEPVRREEIRARQTSSVVGTASRTISRIAASESL